jgi:hypothetical protein
MIIMGTTVKEIKELKGFLPRSIVYAEQINEDFAEGIAGFYKAVWKEREGGLSMRQKHLMVFAIACSNNNTESAVKILERGSSLFLMDKMLFQFTRIGFCDDIHTKQRRAWKGFINLELPEPRSMMP